jgi:uncharacterized membrane protein YphA (DoxX/SURF4 family)
LKTNSLHRLLYPVPLPAILFIRLAVGCIFLSEGIQKFLFPAELGAGRFTKIGIPAPAFFGPFVGAVEITGGVLVLLGLLTRLAAAPLLLIMLVAISTTKLAQLPEVGFWETAHGARTDFAMLLCCLFLLAVGGGKWSADAALLNRNSA